jgi:hypothetical protein
MAEVQEIVDGYRRLAVDDMKRASELFVIADTTGRDEDLKAAMLAHENSAQSTRHYFYVKGQASVEATGSKAVLAHPNRLRIPQQTRTA